MHGIIIQNYFSNCMHVASTIRCILIIHLFTLITITSILLAMTMLIQSTFIPLLKCMQTLVKHRSKSLYTGIGNVIEIAIIKQLLAYFWSCPGHVLG